MTPEQELKMLSDKYEKMLLIKAMRDFIEAEDSNMEQKNWSMMAPRYGLDASLYNARFFNNGHFFFLKEIKPSNRKYPIIAERDDGKSYKFPPDMIQRFFKKVE